MRSLFPIECGNALGHQQARRALQVQLEQQEILVHVDYPVQQVQLVHRVHKVHKVQLELQDPMDYPVLQVFPEPPAILGVQDLLVLQAVLERFWDLNLQLLLLGNFQEPLEVQPTPIPLEILKQESHML